MERRQRVQLQRVERLHTRCRGEIRTRDEQPVLLCAAACLLRWLLQPVAAATLANLQMVRGLPAYMGKPGKGGVARGNRFASWWG